MMMDEYRKQTLFTAPWWVDSNKQPIFGTILLVSESVSLWMDAFNRSMIQQSRLGVSQRPT